MRDLNSEHELAQKAGRKRAQRLYPVLSACEGGCGADAKDRHHIDGNCNNNARSNLLFLCHKCHAAEHPERAQAAGKAAAAAHRAITHCPKGHSYSGDNLYVNSNGYRECKECKRERSRLNYQAQMADPANRESEKERSRQQYQARMADPVKRAALNEAARIRYHARKAAI